jgi:hypothetical protein
MNLPAADQSQRPSTARETWNLITLIVFPGLAFLSVTMHALTFVGYDSREFFPILWWGLQLASVLSLIVGVCFIGIREPYKPATIPWSLDKVLGLFFVLFIIYAAFNFVFTGSVLLRDGGPALIDGHYAHSSHGIITRISKEQYLKEMVYEARQHSGHWMCFHLFAIAATRRKFRLSRGDVES